MLLVIFGAGASYDASPDHRIGNDDARIPLAAGLFGVGLSPVAGFWPEMTPILPLLRYPKRQTTIEQALEDFRSDAKTDPDRNRQLMAVRFYLHHAVSVRQAAWLNVAGDVSNYRTLFEELRTIAPAGEPIALVTYNYDTLLETGLTSQKRLFPNIESYPHDARWPVFKVHGSINWARRTDLNPEIDELSAANEWAVAQEVIRRAEEVTEDGPVVEWTGGIPVSRDPLGSLMPALAVPYRTKQAFEMPTDHEARLRGLLPHVTQVLVVGWRGVDPDLINMIKGAKPTVRTLVVVANERPEETVENLALTAQRTLHHSGGFSEYVLSRSVRDDLR